MPRPRIDASFTPGSVVSIKALDTPSLAEQALDALAEGAFILSADCRLLFANQAAQAMLTSEDALRLRGGRVCESDANDDDSLAKMVAATATFGITNSTCFRTLRGSRLIVTTKVVPSTGTVLALAAEVRRGGRQIAAQLRSAFGLTLAEADIAQSLSMGVALAEIAAARGALPSTVQSQIKAIASKLGCRRQSEIIAIVRTIPQFIDD